MRKQAIVVRDDLDLPIGKLASQVAHASLEAALQTDEDAVESWREAGAKKIVVRCSTKQALDDIRSQSAELGLPSFEVVDAGKTVVEPRTSTALGIGPGPEETVDRVTGSLPLL